MGGRDICAPCDCGVPPDVSRLRVQLAAAEARAVHLGIEMEMAKAQLRGWGDFFSGQPREMPFADAGEHAKNSQLNFAWCLGYDTASESELWKLMVGRADRSAERSQQSEARAVQAEQHAEQHRTLCLAELGGAGVWPCGCHALVVDSYGTRKLLTAADGEIHQECEAHEALQRRVEQAEQARDAERRLRAVDAAAHLHAERTVRSMSAMLGWMNVPPRETLEADIRALKARAQGLEVAASGSQPTGAEQLDALLNAKDDRQIKILPDGSIRDLAPLPDAATPRAKIADGIVQEVAELPDRDSPDGWPEAMLVTSEELRLIVLDHLDAATPAPRWQAIETAPKEEEVIIGGGGCPRVHTNRLLRFGSGPWVWGGLGDKQQPTHWQPLPPPPTVDGAEPVLPTLTAREDRLRCERDAAVQALTGLRRRLIALGQETP